MNQATQNHESSPFKYWGNSQAVTTKQKRKVVAAQRKLRKTKNNLWTTKEA